MKNIIEKAVAMDIKVRTKVKADEASGRYRVHVEMTSRLQVDLTWID